MDQAQEVAPLRYTPLVGELTDDARLWAENRDRARSADRRDGAIYRLDPELRLALNVAIATGRPLLVRGDPGSGKSSFAPYLARNLNARYFEEVVSASTRVEDFLWRFDAVRRLSDAQVRKRQGSLNDSDYVVPGVLWRAFDPDGRFGSDTKPDAVVLIDEIDKADPDVPNGLLVPLGSGRFEVRPTQQVVAVPEGRRIVVIITTNGERQLPPAFLRRCVVVRIPDPTPESLTEIARLHVYGPGNTEPSGSDRELFAVLAARLIQLRGESAGQRERPPGVAEYLDAVWACRTLAVDPDGLHTDSETAAAWKVIEEFTLRKTTVER